MLEEFGSLFCSARISLGSPIARHPFFDYFFCSVSNRLCCVFGNLLYVVSRVFAGIEKI